MHSTQGFLLLYQRLVILYKFSNLGGSLKHGEYDEAYQNPSHCSETESLDESVIRSNLKIYSKMGQKGIQSMHMNKKQ